MIKFIRSEQVDPIAPNQISNFENEIGFSFPEDYKLHMLTHNGGEPESILCIYFNDDSDIDFTHFYPIKDGEGATLNNMYEIGLDILPQGYLCIGTTYTGKIAMNLNNNERGAIYVFYSDGDLTKIADSFTEFVQGLEESECIE